MCVPIWAHAVLSVVCISPHSSPHPPSPSCPVRVPQQRRGAEPGSTPGLPPGPVFSACCVYCVACMFSVRAVCAVWGACLQCVLCVLCGLHVFSVCCVCCVACMSSVRAVCTVWVACCLGPGLVCRRPFGGYLF